MASRSANRRRLGMARRIAVGLLLLAAFSQAKVQLFQRGAILAHARETNRFIISRVEFAKRGSIFASDLKPLAQDDDTYEFNVNFNKVPHSDAFFMALGEASGVPASDLSQMANSGVRSQTWRKPMTSAQARALQNVKLEWRADGVSLGRTNRRAYPLGASAAGFVGAMNDAGPVAGLELSQNKLLSGQNGLTVGIVDRTGAFLPTRLDPETRQRKDGQTLVLTIDSLLQYEAVAALKVAVESNKADSGVAVVMDPRTGDILALANWPSYEPNQEMAGIAARKQSDYNPAYMSVLEPGSTFKILTLAKALDMGVVGPTEPFYCRGSLVVWAGQAVRCDSHGGKRAHGELVPQTAIARSCNCWAATLAGRIGYPSYVRYLEQMGLLEKTNVGLPLETRGQFNYNEYAKPLQLATLGFGQSVSCTPLGLASAFAMLGNGGRRPSPRLIKRIGENETPLGPQSQIIQPKSAAEVLKFMVAVFEDERGTGYSLRIPGYRLAGKTGTAQRVRRVGGGGYVANFVGFVPAEKPRAMVLVMVDNPKAGKYYGGSVAGPVFRQIARAIIRRYAIPPSAATDAAQAPKTN